MKSAEQICVHCIMDTTDPEITFDENGRCNHCRKAEKILARVRKSAAERKKALTALVESIKRRGRGHEYDCIIGVSGGVDSTYVAYMVKQLGLRPLAIHLDNGWNSELAVSNIATTLKRLGIDLYTHVIDWAEFRDLQLAFLKSSTPDSEIPTDHAIFALLFKVAAREKVPYILIGNNLETEAIMPGAWSQGHLDWKYIRNIQKRFGTKALTTFPHVSLFDWCRYRFFHRQKLVSILDYLPYDKAEAMKIIENELGWKYYGGKHYESLYTKFFQAYILPQKFGFDKRKAHFSALICSGQLKREEALKEMSREIYPADKLREDKAYVIKKLGLSEEQFEEIMRLPRQTYWDYPSYKRSLLYDAAKRVKNLLTSRDR